MKKYLKKIILLITLFSLSFSVLALDIIPTKASQKQLEGTLTGKTYIKETKNPSGLKNGKTYYAITAMDAPIDKIFKLITDLKKYPEFMPDMDQVIILDEQNNTAKSTFILGLPMGITKKYRIETNFKNEGKVAYLKWHKLPWNAVSGDDTIVDTQGYWYLTPHPLDQTKTLVKYLVYTDPGKVPFGFGWIVDFMTKKSLPNVFKNTKEALKTM